MNGDKTADRAGRTHKGALLTRQCALTRAEKSADDLIRFVAGPDGKIVPDLARRLPGRGIWISATHSAVADAVKRRIFARALKAPVEAAPDLSDQLDGLLAKRAAQALSLANKAGLVIAGTAKIEALIDAGEAIALVHGRDAAEDGVGKLNRKFAAATLGTGVDGPGKCLQELTVAELSLAMGRSNVVHAALIEGGASQKFIGETERLQRYRSAGAVTFG